LHKEIAAALQKPALPSASPKPARGFSAIAPRNSPADQGGPQNVGEVIRTAGIAPQ